MWAYHFPVLLKDSTKITNFLCKNNFADFTIYVDLYLLVDSVHYYVKAWNWPTILECIWVSHIQKREQEATGAMFSSTQRVLKPNLKSVWNEPLKKQTGREWRASWRRETWAVGCCVALRGIECIFCIVGIIIRGTQQRSLQRTQECGCARVKLKHLPGPENTEAS